ncbi:MAG TPA: magnesium transporter [Actinomycetales bacterium]|nr:magnesium transporter [Actinomycetales bacterium]
MRTETQERRLRRLLGGQLSEARALLDKAPPASLLRMLRRLSHQQRALAFQLLEEQRSWRVLLGLGTREQVQLLADLPPDAGAEVFARLEPDDRARLITHLPGRTSDRLLATLHADARAVTLRLAALPAGSTGRAMSPDVVTVVDTATVAEALREVRDHGSSAQTVYVVAVLGEGQRLAGVVSLRRLLFSDPGMSVRDVMSAEPVTVAVDQPAEQAARIVRSARVLAAPVVDDHGRLAGVLTVDDAMRIIEEAEDDDFAKGASSAPLGRSYGATPVLDLVRSRLGWLLVLIVAAALTVNVLDHFEETLAQAVTLALFVPLLIGTGGNAGAQSATTVVRAMAVGDIGASDVPAVLAREMTTGALLGASLAAVAIGPTWWFAGHGIAVVVSLSLVVICVLATMVGSLTPLVASRFGVDPAVVSAPLISTLVDASGLVIYFLIARAILDLR